jgi:hypothetical protein
MESLAAAAKRKQEWDPLLWPTEVMISLQDDDDERLLAAFTRGKPVGADIDEIVKYGAYAKPGFLMLPSLYTQHKDTALHMASRNGKVKCSLALILNEASCDTENRDRKRPLNLAQRNNRLIFTALHDLALPEKRTFAEFLKGMSLEKKLKWIGLLAPVKSVEHKSIFINSAFEMDATMRKRFYDIMLSMSKEKRRHFIGAMSGMNTDESTTYIHFVAMLTNEANEYFINSMYALPVEVKQMLMGILLDWEPSDMDSRIFTLDETLPPGERVPIYNEPSTVATCFHEIGHGENVVAISADPTEHPTGSTAGDEGATKQLSDGAGEEGEGKEATKDEGGENGEAKDEAGGADEDEGKEGGTDKDDAAEGKEDDKNEGGADAKDAKAAKKDAKAAKKEAKGAKKGGFSFGRKKKTNNQEEEDEAAKAAAEAKAAADMARAEALADWLEITFEEQVLRRTEEDEDEDEDEDDEDDEESATSKTTTVVRAGWMQRRETVRETILLQRRGSAEDLIGRYPHSASDHPLSTSKLQIYSDPAEEVRLDS